MITFTVKFEKDEDLKSLLCSAFEGGSNYWIDSVELSKKPSKSYDWLHEVPFDTKGELKIALSKEGKGSLIEFHFLNLSKIQKGIEIMHNKYPRHYADFISENADAITADVFLQCCLFGETIFG